MSNLKICNIRLNNWINKINRKLFNVRIGLGIWWMGWYRLIKRRRMGKMGRRSIIDWCMDGWMDGIWVICLFYDFYMFLGQELMKIKLVVVTYFKIKTNILNNKHKQKNALIKILRQHQQHRLNKTNIILNTPKHKTNQRWFYAISINDPTTIYRKLYVNNYDDIYW